MPTQHSRLLILGSGPAGYTAAVYAARANLQPGADHRPRAGRPAHDDHRRRQLAGGRRRRAGPGADGALPEARRALRDRNRLRPHPHGRTSSERPFLLEGDAGDYTCDALIIATGAIGEIPRAAVRAEVHGPRRVGLRHLRRLLLQGPGRGGGRRRQHRGRGSALPRRTSRRSVDRGPPARQVPRREDHGRQAHASECARARSSSCSDDVLDEVLGDDTGVTGVRVASIKTGATRDIAAKGLFVAIGHTPNTELFAGQLEMENGYIVTRGGREGVATATSMQGVFAAGDVQDHVYRQAVTSAGTGCMAALDAEKYLDALACLRTRSSGERRATSQPFRAPRRVKLAARAGRCRSRRRRGPTSARRSRNRCRPELDRRRDRLGRGAGLPARRPVAPGAAQAAARPLGGAGRARSPRPEPGAGGERGRGIPRHCRARRFRCVRIVHGKGLRSRNREPVLKGKLRKWLALRDEVLAFCQAPAGRRRQRRGSGSAERNKR